MIKARMLSGTSWHDVCILNISQHGLGIQSARAPQRGSYVEIRRGRQTVVARVAWSSGHRSGLKSQDPIFISALISGTGEGETPAKESAGVHRERRRRPRTPSQAHDASRLAGRAFEFAALAVVGVALATSAASAINSAFARPMTAVAQVLR